MATLAGDYATLHTDHTDGRRMAFSLHLAENWDTHFGCSCVFHCENCLSNMVFMVGGDLVFVQPLATPLILHPSFNTMILFAISV